MSVSFAISIPIGSYHPLLRDCLRSLAIQSPRPLIAALDASGDERVMALLDEFSQLITYRRTGPDGGQSDAIIEGWDNTDAEILGWLNADDALYPGALATVAKHYSDNPDTDVFYGNSVINDDNGAIKGFHWAVEPPSDRILSGGIISQPSCFFRRSLVEAVGGLDRGLHFTMDWDLWIRFWRAEGNFRFSDEVFSRVLWSSDAKTGGFGAARRRELERLIRQNDGIARRFRSRVGFALHHAFEYLLPATVTRAFQVRSARNARSIHGIDRAGGISARAQIPIVHFDKGEKKGLSITIEGRNGALKIAAGGTKIDVRGGGVHSLAFARNVPAEETLTVEFENISDQPMRVTQLDWA